MSARQPPLTAKFPEKLAPLFKPARYKVLYGGRGGAKSWGIARALLIIGAERPLRIVCGREIQQSIADSVHELISDQVKSLGLASFYTVLDTEIRGINGTQFKFVGLRALDVENIKSLEGADICWVEEANAVSKKSWDVLIPTIRKPDSEIWLSFNPELDTDETYKRFVVNTPPNAIKIPISWRDNPWFPSVLEDERRHMQETDPTAYENVWEGKCKPAVEGAIYAEEVRLLVEQGRYRPVPYDQLLRVHTIWDLGWNDSMVILLAQRAASELRIIECLEGSHRTYDSWVKELESRDYRWGTDWLPHDAKAANPQTGKSSVEIVRALGRKVDVVPEIGVEQGIQSARMMMRRLYIDNERDSGLLDHLRRYRRAINKATNEPGAPLHDEHSHAADALRYLSVIADKMSNDEFWNKKLNINTKGIH